MKMRKIFVVLLSALMLLTMIPAVSFGAALPFKDVPSGEWYYNDVKSAYETGLINGMDDTTFAPESNMTYAQAVKLAACMHQKHTTGVVALRNGDPWYQTYVDYAKTTHIISKDYDWNSPATRAGYVEIFAHALPDEALQVKNLIPDGVIPDVGMAHPQAEEIYKLYRAGILNGTDNKGTFQPNNSITRAEVAAIVIRMMDASARKSVTLGSGDDPEHHSGPEIQQELRIVKEPLDTELMNGAAVLSVAVSGNFDIITYLWEKKVGETWRDVTTLNTEKVTFNLVGSAMTVISPDNSSGVGEYRCTITALNDSPYTPEVTMAGQLVTRTAKINPSAETMEAWLDKGVYRNFIDKSDMSRDTIRFYTYHNLRKTDQTYMDKPVWEESQEHVMRSATTPEEFVEWNTYGGNPWVFHPDPADMFSWGDDVKVKVATISGGTPPYTYSWEMGPNKYGNNVTLIEGYNCAGQGTDTIYVYAPMGIKGDDPVELGYIDCKITDTLGRVCYATCWRYKYGSGYMFSYVRPYALRADHSWFSRSNDRTRSKTPIWTKDKV